MRHDAKPGADCDLQIRRTISYHVCARNLASGRFPTQDQQLGTHYLLIYEEFKRQQLLGDSYFLIGV